MERVADGAKRRPGRVAELADRSTKPELRAVDITGSGHLSTGDVRELMQTRTGRWPVWLPFVEPAKYDAAAFCRDVERIRTVYRSLGFHRVQVDTSVARPKPGAVALTVHIHEGSRTRVDEVTLKGLSGTVLDTAVVRRGMRTQPGTFLLRHDLEQDRGELLARLQETGYPFAEVAVRLQISGQDDPRAALTFAADPGPRCRIGAVRVSGLRRVARGLVRRGTTFASGQVYDRRELVATQQQLLRSGVFRSVVVNVPDSSARSCPVPVSIQVRERPPRHIKVGVGVASEERVRGSVDMQHRSLFGYATHLDLQAEASLLLQAVRAGLHRPFLWDSRTSLTVDLFAEREELPGYHVQRAGAESRVDRSVSATTRIGLVTRVETIDDRLAGRSSSLALTVNRDTRPTLFSPHRGHVIDVRVEEDGWFLQARHELVKVRAMGCAYRPLPWFDVGAVRLALGAVMPLRGDEALPRFRRLYAGGASSVRGWDLDELGPRDPDGGVSGGRSLVEMGLELRPQLPGPFSGALFVDAGSVQRRYSAYDPRTWSWAWGCGLRYLTPVGNLRVDAAVPVVEDPGEWASWHMYFSLGQAF